MLVRIGHLECRYRLRAGVAASREAASRIESLQPQLWQDVSNQLEQILQDDPTVYILRHAESHLSMNRVPSFGEAQLATPWVSRLSAQVLDSLDAGGENLQCFADQGEFAAQFMTDLLDGDAWSQWFYGAFQHVHSQPLEQALLTVLEENRPHIGGILAGLHRRGALEKFLKQIELRRLMELGLYDSPPSRDAASTPTFFYFASQIVDQLGLWSNASPRQEILSEYLQTAIPPTDWRDQHSLSDALLNVLRFLLRRGFIQRTTSASLSVRLEPALAQLDWLDTGYLRTAIPALFEMQASPALPLRPSQGEAVLSPRQRLLVDDLLAALSRYADQLDRDNPTSPANYFRLVAWVAGSQPGWLDDVQVRMLLQHLLEAWAALASQSDSVGLLRRMAEGGTCPPELLPIMELGKPGVELLEKLIKASDETALKVYSHCAGVSLLLRMLLDTRLLTLADYLPLEDLHPGLKPQATLLLGLLLCWGGVEGSREGKIDPGLMLLAGLHHSDPKSLTLKDFERVCVSLEAPGALEGFNPVWLRMLVGQRMLDGETLHLYHLQMGEDWLILVMDGTGLCLFGQTESSEHINPDLIESWVSNWTLACGLEPLIVCEAELRDVLPASARTAFVISGTDDALTLAHDQFLQELIPALQTLSGNSVGLPLTIIALAGLRLWARWLANFAGSSASYLLSNFIHRAGRFYLEMGRVRAELDSLPLDLVLQMAGYTTPLEVLPWLGDRRLEFIL